MATKKDKEDLKRMKEDLRWVRRLQLLIWMVSIGMVLILIALILLLREISP